MRSTAAGHLGSPRAGITHGRRRRRAAWGLLGGVRRLRKLAAHYSGVPVSREMRRFDPRGKLVSEQSAKSLGVSRRPMRFSKYPMQSFPTPLGLAWSQR